MRKTCIIEFKEFRKHAKFRGKTFWKGNFHLKRRTKDKAVIENRIVKIVFVCLVLFSFKLNIHQILLEKKEMVKKVLSFA